MQPYCHQNHYLDGYRLISLSFLNMSSKKVLIVGVDSIIGSALEKALISDGYCVTGSTRRLSPLTYNRIYLDLGDPSYINLSNISFDIAVICGAITSLGICEDYSSTSRKINVDGTVKLGNLIKQSGAFNFLSTNLVFDGTKPHYLADDPPNPLTEYGKQKAEVENLFYLLMGHRQ